MKDRYIPIRPVLDASHLSRFIGFSASLVESLKKQSRRMIGTLLHTCRDELTRELAVNPTDQALALALVKSAMLDLIGIGWKIKVKRGQVGIALPVSESKEQEELKDLIRQGHLLERDAQLRQQSVRDFVRGMEQRRLTDKGWHSIFSVMRDGGELASALGATENRGNAVQKLARLGEIVSPYIQPVTEDGLCAQTGLPLRDIWRYFRHTWTNSYKSLPGRSMSFLIRDGAAPNHPVVGIAALGSSVAQQRLRDEWIGWDQDRMVKAILKTPNAKYAKWLIHCLNEQVEALYLADLFFDGTCKREELLSPSADLIARLEARGDAEIKLHQLYPQTAAHKARPTDGGPDAYWEEQAQTHLFRSKRCKTLAKLLWIAMVFQECDLKKGTGAELRSAMAKERMRNAVMHLIRFVKAQHVGIDMMDIVVCGAIAPYNTVLGGSWSACCCAVRKLLRGIGNGTLHKPA